MPFTPLRDALNQKMVRQGPLKKQVVASRAVETARQVFEELFGVELSAHASPLFLKNRTLTVSCTSSVVAQEIRLNQAKIVEKINNTLGNDEVDRIRYLS